MAISGHQRQSVVINALIGGTLIDGPVEAFEGAEQPAALRIDEQQGRLGAREQQLWGNRGRGAVVSSSRVGSALVSSSCARPSIRSHSDLIRISLGSHSDLIKSSSEAIKGNYLRHGSLSEQSDRRSSRAHQRQSRAITCAMAASVSNRTEGTSFQPFDPSATRHAPSGTSIGRRAAVRPEAKEPRAVPSSPLPPQNQRPPPLPLHHQSADSPARGHSGAMRDVIRGNKGGHQGQLGTSSGAICTPPPASR